MGKIKIIFFIILAFIIYKGVIAFKNFEIGVSDKVAEIEELADFEKEGEVIGLMMYLGDPPELKEHFFTESRSKCLELKEVAETMIWESIVETVAAIKAQKTIPAKNGVNKDLTIAIKR